jgi:hypothetical protein
LHQKLAKLIFLCKVFLIRNSREKSLFLALNLKLCCLKTADTFYWSRNWSDAPLVMLSHKNDKKSSSRNVLTFTSVMIGRSSSIRASYSFCLYFVMLQACCSRYYILDSLSASLSVVVVVSKQFKETKC